MVKRMVLEHIPGLMENNIKDSGKMIYKMGMVNWLSKVANQFN